MAGVVSDDVGGRGPGYRRRGRDEPHQCKRNRSQHGRGGKPPIQSAHPPGAYAQFSPRARLTGGAIGTSRQAAFGAVLWRGLRVPRVRIDLLPR
jgi:hypothetical protein